MAESEDKLNPITAQKYLAGLDYPANKDEIIDCARDNDANDRIMQFFERIPDREYDSPVQLSEAIGGMDSSSDDRQDRAA